jgi:hypothetical protein
MKLAAKAAGVAPELLAVVLAVWPELREAIDELRKADWEAVDGPTKAKLIADELEDVADALDDHVPGWNSKLSEAQRDDFLYHVKGAILGQVETLYHLKLAGELLEAAGVITAPKRLVERLRGRRKVSVGSRSQR